MRSYRQGSENAVFFHCSRCGVLTAVLCCIEGRVHGAINARTPDRGVDADRAQPIPFDTPGAAERLARWRKLWIGDVLWIDDIARARAAHALDELHSNQ